MTVDAPDVPGPGGDRSTAADGGEPAADGGDLAADGGEPAADRVETTTDAATGGALVDRLPIRPGRTLAVLDREFRTVLRTPALLVLAAGFLAVVVGVAFLGSGGGAGYVPLALDLLAPVEVLVPLLAFAFGARSVRSDAERGELDVVRTFPVDRSEYVVGVIAGRAAALLPVVVGSLLVAGIVPALSAGGPTVVATHAGGDSPLLYLRFVVLAAAFATVVLAVAVAVSTVARSARETIALAVVLLIALVVGIDGGLVAAVGGGLLDGADLAVATALSPNGAVRGLVLALVADPISSAGPGPVGVVAGVTGLAGWLVGAVAVAVAKVW